MSLLDNIFQIIFQNENFLVINKKDGLPTQRSNDYKFSIEEQLSSCGSPFSSLPRCGIVHRLDKDTTGLLIIAKNEKTFLSLKSLFKERKVKKTYLSLHRGILASSSGEIRFYQKKVFARKKAVRMRTDPLVGKLVDISFQLVKTMNNFSLLEVLPLTGRTHQIRLAFQKIRFPIYNDPLYNTEKPVNTHGQYLHAWKLSFNLGGAFFEFKAEVPLFFQNELNNLQITFS